MHHKLTVTLALVIALSAFPLYAHAKAEAVRRAGGVDSTGSPQAAVAVHLYLPALRRTLHATPQKPQPTCDAAYPTVCILPPSPDLDCGDIPHRSFTVLPPDPHHFDADGDGLGCE